MRSNTLWRLVLVALLGACVPTRLVDTWRDPAYQGPPLQKVLACGLHPNEGTRRMIEDELVKELQPRGVEAVPCYRVLPEGRPTEEQLHEAVRQAGAQGAVVTRYAGAREEVHYEPPFIGVGPAYYWAPFYSAYGPTWDFVYGPGYVEVDVAVRLVTNVYRVDDGGELLWSGTSETLNPDSTTQLVDKALPKVLSKVSQAGILPPEKK